MECPILSVFQFKIEGHTKPKGNAKRIYRNSRTGRQFIGSTSKYKDHEQSVIRQLIAQKIYLGPKFFPVKYPSHVDYLFSFTDKRRADFDNLCKSINDCLQRAHIIENDKYIMEATIQIIIGEVAQTIVTIHTKT